MSKQRESVPPAGRKRVREETVPTGNASINGSDGNIDAVLNDPATYQTLSELLKTYCESPELVKAISDFKASLTDHTKLDVSNILRPKDLPPAVAVFFWAVLWSRTSESCKHQLQEATNKMSKMNQSQEENRQKKLALRSKLMEIMSTALNAASK
jgi:hypothetical protein